MKQKSTLMPAPNKIKWVENSKKVVPLGFVLTPQTSVHEFKVSIGVKDSDAQIYVGMAEEQYFCSVETIDGFVEKAEVFRPALIT